MIQESENNSNIRAFAEYLSKCVKNSIEVCDKCHNITFNHQKDGNDIICCVCNLIKNHEEPKDLTILQLRYTQCMLCKSIIQYRIQRLNESINQCKNSKKDNNINILLKEEIKRCEDTKSPLLFMLKEINKESIKFKKNYILSKFFKK